MHGRLKVKSTEQQKAERQAKRDEKLKTYQYAMGKIFENRESWKNSAAGKTPIDAWKITAGVLMANPDISTLWAVRKENIEKEVLILEEKPEEHDKILTKELDLTIQCLKENPKSYGAWHHRCWSLLKMKKPQWDQELMLCNKYLELDERNFHCWDYRRFVVENASIPAEQELKYTDEKIKANFSNYSAWHYRSRLLPIVYPLNGKNSEDKISKEKRRSELDLVSNAVFTDPFDSSAWFYHKWLLGRPDDSLMPVKAKRHGETIIVAFSRPVDSSQIQVFFIGDDDHEQKSVESSIVWSSANGQKYDTLWMTSKLNLKSTTETTSSMSVIRIQLANNSQHFLEITAKNPVAWKSGEVMDSATSQVLKQELENFQDLLEEDPDCKWALYTKVLIMKTIDPVKYHQEIVKDFEMLCQIDSSRQGYYRDQRSKFIIQSVLSNNNSGDHIDLSNQGLTSVSNFKELFAFANSINLTKNNLKSVDALLPYLISCQELFLDDNDIQNIDRSSIGKSLESLSIKSNPISNDVS